MAEKAELLWPRLPRKRGRGQACQVLQGRIFLVSLVKNPESPAWPGFARLAGFLTGVLMQGHDKTSPVTYMYNTKMKCTLYLKYMNS